MGHGIGHVQLQYIIYPLTESPNRALLALVSMATSWRMCLGSVATINASSTTSRKRYRAHGRRA